MSNSKKIKKSRKKTFNSQTEHMEVKHFSGLTPSPENLQGFEDIIPGSAERFMIMAEKQVDSRIFFEKQAIINETKIIESQINRDKLGMWLGFIISLIAMGISTYLAINGATVTASIFGAGGISGLAGVFVKNIRNK